MKDINTDNHFQKTMQIKVEQGVFEQIISQAKQDGIQKLVVGAVIVRGGKFLLLERAVSDFMGGLVELPSGSVDDGEDLPTALTREVKEETGLTVTSINAYLGSFDYTSGSGKKARQFNFLVDVSSDEVKLEPQEHQAFHLVSQSDEKFAALNTSDATRAVLKTALIS